MKWWAAQHRAVLAAVRRSPTPVHHRLGELPVLDHMPGLFGQPDLIHRANLTYAVDPAVLPPGVEPYAYRWLARTYAPRFWFPEVYGAAPLILVRPKGGTLHLPDVLIALPYFRVMEELADGLTAAPEAAHKALHGWLATADRRVLDRVELLEAAAGPDHPTMVRDYLRAAGCPGC